MKHSRVRLSVPLKIGEIGGRSAGTIRWTRQVLWASPVAHSRGCKAMNPAPCLSIPRLKSMYPRECVAILHCLRLMCITPSSRLESDTEMAKVTWERRELDAGKVSCGSRVSASLMSTRRTKGAKRDSMELGVSTSTPRLFMILLLYVIPHDGQRRRKRDEDGDNTDDSLD